MRENSLESAAEFIRTREPVEFSLNVMVEYADWLRQEEERSLEERKQAFIDSLKPFVEDMGKEEANKFYKYWTQIAKRGKKYKFEKEDTWAINLRIATWMSNKRKTSIANMLKK